MKIFFTGGSGFVGQNVIPILVENGHEVFAIARSDRSVAKVRSVGATPIQDDLLQLTDNTAKAMAACDWVVHSAAHMDFTYDPKPYYDLNVKATSALLKMAREAGIQKFLYISAAPVVPGSPIVNMTEAMASDALPQALYPKTKAIAERAVLAANAEGFQTISLRPPAIWGPDNHHLFEMMDMAKKGKWRWIGGGNQILSTIHVANLAHAILAGLTSNESGKAYFVTDGDRRSMRTTFEAIFKAKGVDAGNKNLPRRLVGFLAQVIGGTWKILGIKSRPPIAPLMVRLMGTEFSVSDQKARKELGYRNTISFEEGIAELKV